MTRDLETECRILISTAEACWREHEPSQSFHVLEWLCWRQRLRYPLVRNRDNIFSNGDFIT